MLLSTLKDIRAKIFQAIDFLNVLYSQIISYLSHKRKNRPAMRACSYCVLVCIDM